MINNEKKEIKNRTTTNVMGFLLLALIFGAIVCILNYDRLQSRTAHAISSNNILLQAKNFKQRKKPNFDMKKVSPISPKTLAHAWRYRHDYRAIGQIAVPQNNIALNIYAGCSNDVLALGAGTMRSDQKMGENNYPLAGHNMDDGVSYFSPLYSAKVNDKLSKSTTIFLTNFKTVYYYRVDLAKFISINNLWLANNQKYYAKKPVISLFTCDWTGTGRLYVRGHLTGKQSLKSASRYVKSVFKM